MERKWTDRQYNVQDNADVSHEYVKMYCNTNKLPTLPFDDPHSKHHDVKWSSKQHHLRSDQK